MSFERMIRRRAERIFKRNKRPISTEKELPTPPGMFRCSVTFRGCELEWVANESKVRHAYDEAMQLLAHLKRLKRPEANNFDEHVLSTIVTRLETGAHQKPEFSANTASLVMHVIWSRREELQARFDDLSRITVMLGEEGEFISIAFGIKFKSDIDLPEPELIDIWRT